MTLSRCSSAGVHGVFVLLFFGGGIDEDTSLASSPCCPPSLGSPRLVEGMGDDIGGMAANGADPGALRFRVCDGGELA